MSDLATTAPAFVAMAHQIVWCSAATVPVWDGPLSDSFAALRLEPWHLRVFPGSVLLGTGGEVLTWRAPE